MEVTFDTRYNRRPIGINKCLDSGLFKIYQCSIPMQCIPKTCPKSILCIDLDKRKQTKKMTVPELSI